MPFVISKFFFGLFLHHQVEKNSLKELSIEERMTHHESRDVCLC